MVVQPDTSCLPTSGSGWKRTTKAQQKNMAVETVSSTKRKHKKSIILSKHTRRKRGKRGRLNHTREINTKDNEAV